MKVKEMIKILKGFDKEKEICTFKGGSQITEIKPFDIKVVQDKVVIEE